MTFTNHVDANADAHSILLDLGPDRRGQNLHIETVRNAPIFTCMAGKAVDSEESLPGYESFGLLGQQIEVINPLESVGGGGMGATDERRVFLNSNAPHSTFICGVQGSGKSNSLACIIENFLLAIPQLGVLPAPLTALVFHFDHHSTTPCEATYLASHLPVTVLVAPSSLARAKRLYGSLPVAEENMKIFPLHLHERDLNVGRMLTLMAVDRTEERPPLYLEVVRKILRSMANTERRFRYSRFKQLLEREELSPGQRGPLNLRIALLESFMGDETQNENFWEPEPGRLIVVDLSDPFVDESTACSLFEICLHLFLEHPGKVGRVVALDEAHKYMSATASAQTFTDTLLSTIRVERHVATRIVISTQEPTISGKLLDLCTCTLVHRFSSPEWLNFLKQHIAAVGQEENMRHNMIQRIVNLNCGEAYLFAPSGLMVSPCCQEKEDSWLEDYSDKESNGRLEKFGLRYMKVKIRRRVTEDGGMSVMAVEQMKLGENE